MANWNWDDFVVQAGASTIGGVIAALIALGVVKAERNRRLADVAMHDRDRRADAADELRGERSRVVADLLEMVASALDEDQPPLPNRHVDVALLRLTFDGTEDGYDVYRWARWKLAQIQKVESGSVIWIRPAFDEYDRVRGMLAEWISPNGSLGAITAMRRELESHAGDGRTDGD